MKILRIVIVVATVLPLTSCLITVYDQDEFFPPPTAPEDHGPPVELCDEGREPGIHSSYHAPARHVPRPPVDPEIKRQFLLLFHREGNPTHVHVTPHDPPTAESIQSSPLPVAVAEAINALVPRDAFFYSFAPRHIEATIILQNQFLQQRSAADLVTFARGVLVGHDINKRVWYYALVGTLLMRPDLNGYYLAWALDATPDLYIPFSILQAAFQGTSSRPASVPVVSECVTATGETARDVRLLQLLGQSPGVGEVEQKLLRRKRDDGVEEKKRTKRQFGQVGGLENCLVYNGTTGASGEENRLWYFREDAMLNQHHWYWHQYFPQASLRHADRRGEVFYYMHHNIIARYNAERLSNGLDRETPLDLRLGGNVGEGYNADLVEAQSRRFWTPRLPNTPLNDINHQNDPDFLLGVTMNEIFSTYQTLVSHIAQGILIANQSQQTGQPPSEFPLDIRNPAGLSHLGNTFEAAEELSVHPNLYHAYGVHNLGHIAIALSTDPDFTCQRPTGVMADLTVTMRDPAFYKIHGLVDEVFDQYKMTLPPYQLVSGEWPLIWQGVQIQDFSILTNGGKESKLLNTFWSIRKLPLEEGIDGSIHEGDVDISICHQHLDHEPFTFKITVDISECLQAASTRGTMRIFMAPRYDLKGNRFGMEDTRRLMFQLDAFPVELRQGRNTITRHSHDSSSTKPWSRSLQDMLRDHDNGGQTEYCGCGWPDHLYIPKGTPQGMEFDLFAMLTDFGHDRVQDSREDLRIPEPCNSPYLFCGVPYRRYPDARPLGYPFDRLPYSVLEGGVVRPVISLEEYVAHVPNMKSSVVIVQHIDTLVQ